MPTRPAAAATARAPARRAGAWLAAAVLAVVASGTASGANALPEALPVSASTAASTAASPPSPAPSAAARPIVLVDDRGTAHRWPAPPRRLVSLLPSLTEIVAAVGAGDRLVGVDRASNWPPALERLPRLGGLDDARIEAIATLKPDAILASTAARSLDRLEALGFEVVRLKSESHADVRRALLAVATLAGRPEAGGAVWQRLERELADAAARVPPGWRGRRVYVEIGGGPYAAGPGSFIGETLARLGLVNIVPAELGPFPKLNPEFIVRARPELILGAASEQAALVGRPGWDTLPAVRARRLCGFDAVHYDALVRPGPRLGASAASIVDCLAALPPPDAR